MSNNSIFYTSKPTREQLSWHVKQMGYSGEPGFMNAEAAASRRMVYEKEETEIDVGDESCSNGVCPIR